jgi:ATP-dependent helicase/nuclease subunit B
MPWSGGTRLRNEELDQAQSLLGQLQAALAPLERVASSRPHDFAELAKVPPRGC